MTSSLCKSFNILKGFVGYAFSPKLVDIIIVDVTSFTKASSAVRTPFSFFLMADDVRLRKTTETMNGGGSFYVLYFFSPRTDE